MIAITNMIQRTNGETAPIQSMSWRKPAKPAKRSWGIWYLSPKCSPSALPSHPSSSYSKRIPQYPSKQFNTETFPSQMRRRTNLRPGDNSFMVVNGRGLREAIRLGSFIIYAHRTLVFDFYPPPTSSQPTPTKSPHEKCHRTGNVLPCLQKSRPSHSKKCLFGHQLL